MRTRVILAAVALLAFARIASAQEQRPALKPTSSTAAKQTTPPLALEIFYNSTLAPAYLMIEGADVKPHWIWITRFSTLPGWQLPQGAQRINAVRVTSQWNGETAEVRVTLLRGVNFYDEEEEVTSYQTGLGEPTDISKLESYGIHRFKITLISPKTAVPPPPGLENRTLSVEFAKIESEGLPLPAYRATFRNLSTKKLAALKLLAYRGGRGPGTMLFQGEDGRPLIESNEMFSRRISIDLAEKIGESYAPGAPAANLIIISSAVFTDGTFEGDAEPACSYEKLVFGRKAWLKSALKIIEEHLSQPDDPQSAQQLKEKFRALRYARTGVESVMRSAVAAQCPSPTAFAEGTFSALNLQLISDLDTVTKTRPKPLVTFGAWLESTRQRYRQWLNNLNEFPAPRAVTSQ